MTPEKLKKANELSKRIEVLETAYSELKNIQNETEVETDLDYNATLCKHGDGSGWNVDFTGANVGFDLLCAVLEFTTKKLQELRKEFEEI